MRSQESFVTRVNLSTNCEKLAKIGADLQCVLRFSLLRAVKITTFTLLSLKQMSLNVIRNADAFARPRGVREGGSVEPFHPPPAYGPVNSPVSKFAE